MLFVGVDTGGTFTDFVFFKEGRFEVLKVPSTPDNPAQAVLEGLKVVGGEGRMIVHGSTVATNALLERKGAKTALITNKGFEDVIEIGRQNRERLYDLHYRKQKPLVPRELCWGVRCRMDHRGNILEELDEDELLRIKEKIISEGIEAVAVCFLHSYANPQHEKRVKELLSSVEGLHISLSCEILPEFREFERTSTTVVNAYVSPKMSGYLSYLEENLGKEDRLSVMQSNGGIISTRLAKEEAVRTILSGPAGGIVSALHIGKLIGQTKLITFDMGGTSTDVSLIDGEPSLTTETKISGLPVKVPMIDIHTIGAGGGSVAWIDEGGLLRVGPRSAGAQPGPVCYGKGGKEITVTDANLFLGRLIPDKFLGGKMRIYPELLKEPLEILSRRLDTHPEEVAKAILEIANSNMVKALRKVSVQRGYNPQDFYLISYGGAGGLHAVFLARELGIQKVVIPPNPGIFSAIGMLLADITRDYSLTVMLNSSETSYSQLKEMFSELESRAIRDMENEGFPPEALLFTRLLDMRYKGQSYELMVPFGDNFREEFSALHERTYGYTHDREAEIVNLRLRVVVTTPKPTFPSHEKKFPENPDRAFEGVFRGFKVYNRDKLLWGNVIEGPAIVTEYSSTTLIPEGSVAHVDRLGSLIVEA